MLSVPTFFKPHANDTRSLNTVRLARNLTGLWAMMLATAVLLATGTSASASESMHIASDARAALQRLAETGRLSDADRATLKKYPKIGSKIVDPGLTTMSVTVEPAKGSTAEAGVLGGPGCWIGNAHVDGHYALGGLAYRFHFRVDWCENTRAVTSVHYRNGWFTHVGTFMNPHDRPVENWVTPVNQFNVTAKWKAKITNKIPGTPWEASSYPYIRWELTASAYRQDIAYRGIEG